MVLYPNFRKSLGLEKDKTYRFAYEELVLRVFAFSDWINVYKGGLANFLNDYMEEYKNIDDARKTQMKQNFERVVDLLYFRILKKKKLPKISKTTTEGLLVGIFNNINDLENQTDSALIKKYLLLRNDKLYSLQNLKEGLSGREKVQNRLKRAIEIFQ